MSMPMDNRVGRRIWTSTPMTFVPGGKFDTGIFAGKKINDASPMVTFAVSFVKLIGPAGMLVRNASWPFSQTTAPSTRERRKLRLVMAVLAGGTNVSRK